MKKLFLMLFIFFIVGCKYDQNDFLNEQKQIYNNESCFCQCQMDNSLNYSILGTYNYEILQCYQLCDLKGDK